MLYIPGKSFPGKGDTTSPYEVLTKLRLSLLFIYVIYVIKTQKKITNFSHGASLAKAVSVGVVLIYTQ